MRPSNNQVGNRSIRDGSRHLRARRCGVGKVMNDTYPNPKQFFGPLLGIEDKKRIPVRVHINVTDVSTPAVYIPELRGFYEQPF